MSCTADAEPPNVKNTHYLVKNLPLSSAIELVRGCVLCGVFLLRPVVHLFDGTLD